MKVPNTRAAAGKLLKVGGKPEVVSVTKITANDRRLQAAGKINISPAGKDQVQVKALR